jgi:hypothetical protein
MDHSINHSINLSGNRSVEHSDWFTQWVTFVPAPRTLSREAESTTDSAIQSVVKPILRVSHAMLCQEAPKRYADTQFSEEWLTFVLASRTLSIEAESTTDSSIQAVDKTILRVSHAMLCQGSPQPLRRHSIF